MDFFQNKDPVFNNDLVRCNFCSNSSFLGTALCGKKWSRERVKGECALWFGLITRPVVHWRKRRQLTWLDAFQEQDYCTSPQYKQIAQNTTRHWRDWSQLLSYTIYFIRSFCTSTVLLLRWSLAKIPTSIVCKNKGAKHVP